MPSTNRNRVKGRSDTRRFVGIPFELLQTRKYSELSSHAVKLLVDILRSFNGSNNGNLQCVWSELRALGWKSKGTIDRALRELLACGFIEQSRQGGRHKCSLYAVTWRAIDEVIDQKTGRHKLDIPPTRTPKGTWRD